MLANRRRPLASRDLVSSLHLAVSEGVTVLVVGVHDEAYDGDEHEYEHRGRHRHPHRPAYGGSKVRLNQEAEIAFQLWGSKLFKLLHRRQI